MDASHVQPMVGLRQIIPACAHCYAETWARRVGMELWGGALHDGSSASITGVNHCVGMSKQTTRRACARLFCASMADVFEPRTDFDLWREKLWSSIEKTPHLDWLLLTKRPGHIKHVYPWAKPASRQRLAWDYCGKSTMGRAPHRATNYRRRARPISILRAFAVLHRSDAMAQGRSDRWVIAGGERVPKLVQRIPTGFGHCVINAASTQFHSTSNNGDIGALKLKVNPPRKSLSCMTKLVDSSAFHGARRSTAVVLSMAVHTTGIHT